jgi:isopentenyldiphosphate isomerase
MSAPIQLVDEHDRPIRAGTKQEAWKHGYWHRIVRIMLDDGKGNVLLQHRSPTKDVYPNCWDNSAAGHVDAGETYEQAAYRELAEEIGVSDIVLHEVGHYKDARTWDGLRMNTFVRVYCATATGTPQGKEPGKIDDVRWFTRAAVKQLVLEQPPQATDGLIQVIKRYFQ